MPNCIKIALITHDGSKGLIQKCQAFFIWDKRLKAIYSLCHQLIENIEIQVNNECLKNFYQTITTI